jgi:hypothetical protein
MGDTHVYKRRGAGMHAYRHTQHRNAIGQFLSLKKGKSAKNTFSLFSAILLTAVTFHVYMYSLKIPKIELERNIYEREVIPQLVFLMYTGMANS